MIAKGRNMVQAHIDETDQVLKRLLTEVPLMIKEEFHKMDNENKEIAKDSADGDVEVEQSIYNSLSKDYRMDNEDAMIQNFYKSMVLMVCSYCETSMKFMLSTRKLPRYGKKKTSYIDRLLKGINRVYGLNVKIDLFWSGKSEFCTLRNDIAHNFVEIPFISKEYIAVNLDGVKRLLRHLADEVDKKNQVSQ